MPFDVDEFRLGRERVIIALVVLPGEKNWSPDELMEELEALTETAGGEVVGKVIQQRQKPDSRFFLGKGKTSGLKEMISKKNAQTLIVDNDLSPGQLRNLEEELGVKVLDRCALILDIFSKRARTREAKTQVELAELEYWLPRLTGQWDHLSRQEGGIGVRGGPGEKQLEMDRRMVQDRITKLKNDLEKIKTRSKQRRKRREDCYRIALVGYTNAGKSTILNSLTEADVDIEDQLFATLDSTVRSLDEVGGQEVLLSDTVGFIRKLPHQLVASFNSTLAEAAESDLLLHVVDISHNNFEQHIEASREVLDEIMEDRQNCVMVFNKTDKLENTNRIKRMKNHYPDAIFTSALNKEENHNLRERIIQRVNQDFNEGEITLSNQEQKTISQIYTLAEVMSRTYVDSKVKIKYRASKRNSKIIEDMVEKSVNPT